MIDLTGIKSIIFDFGGVILNIDPKLSERKFRDLGLDSVDSMFSQTGKDDIFKKLDTGQIEVSEFRNELREYLQKEISNSEFDAAWNSMLLDIPTERIEVLKRLNSSFQLFLLSNTNKIHYDHYLADLTHVYGYNSFNDLFKKAYFSFEVGLRKPGAEIFELVLNENHLLPEETLFIDDTLKHTEGAAKIGIQTHFLEKGQDISNLL